MRLIDADALKNNMFHYAAPEMVWDKGDIEHKINEMPTIDAIPVAKYKAEIETLRSRCYPGAEDAFGRKAYGCLKIVPVSYGTKSVDAIPVEWLEKKLHEGYHRMCVKAVLDMWQKEQEAQNG